MRTIPRGFRIMESNLLQTFWSLSSIEEEERIGAAKKLLTLLKGHQELSEGDAICHELKYAVQRLVRGLASSRKGARHGFYSALTEVLVQFPQLPTSQVLELIHSHLDVGKGMKASEERGACFGKGFALLALVCSGTLKRTEDLVSVTKQLVALEKKKTYLQEFCTSIICQLLDKYPGTSVCKDHLISEMDLDGGWESCTTEQLQLLLHLSRCHHKEEWFQEFLQVHWNTKHIWSHKNFKRMITPLLASSSSVPRLHSVWQLVLDAVRGKGHFRKFWTTIVDDGLFTSSRDRKYVGFQLVEKLLPSLLADEVGVVFSPNLLHCLMNNSHSAGNSLYPAVNHLLAQLGSFVDTIDDQEMLATLLTHLQRKTSGKFDRLSGSKIVELIISKVNVDGVHHIMEILQQMLTGQACSEPQGEELHEVQLWGVGQLLGLVRNPRLPRRGPWLLSVATLLLGHAFFSLTAHSTNKLPLSLMAPMSALEPSVQEDCRLRFMSVLTDLTSMPLPLPDQGGMVHPGKRPHCPPGMMEDGVYFITALFKVTQQLMASDGVLLLHPFSNEDQSSWRVTCQTVETLSTKSDMECEEKAFLLLFSAMGLGLLPHNERDHYRSTISELEVCLTQMSQGQQRKGRTPQRKKLNSSKWMAVLTDLLLGLLSQPSQLWRTIVEQVFRLLTGRVTMECLQLILAVLKPKQAVEDLMEEGKEEDEESEEESKENESESSGSEEGEREGGGVDPAFAQEVRRALGVAAAVDSNEESEDSPDDDAMMAIDKALGEVFRTRFALKHQKKQQKDDEKSLLHFKLRVLDLIELFLRKEPSNPLIFDLIVPLYEVVHAAQSFKSHVDLVEKAGDIFKNRLCHAKEYPKSGFDASAIHNKLYQLLQHLYKSNPCTSPLATAGIMFLIRVLRGTSAPPLISPITTRSARKRKEHERENPPKMPDRGQLDVSMVTEWFSDALHHFITVKNSSIPPHFFSTYIQRYPNLASLLLPRMVQDLPAAANHFKKAQVQEMVAVLVSSGGEERTLDGLSSEDAEAVHAILAKTAKKKTKRKKVKLHSTELQ